MKSKQKTKIYILMIISIFFFLHINIIDFHEINFENDKKSEDNLILNIKSSGFWVFNGSTFVITNWASSASTYTWISGNGTIINPYTIENVTMMDYDHQANIWITDTSDYFVIRNCTFIGEGTGLDITSSDNGLIINNTFSKTGTGIRTQGYSQNIKIINNTFHDNSNGIDISQGISFNISYNSFRNNRYGLQMINDPSNSLIYSNTFEDTQYGIYLMWIFGTNNNFSSNIMNGCGFYYFAPSPVWAETHIIETSNLINGKPLYFYYNKLNLKPANFTNAGQVILIQCNNSMVSDLDISNCAVGISLDLCKNNTIADSNFSNSGIVLVSSKNITLNNNNVTHFDSYGIYLSSGTGYNMTNNQMFNCGLGIGGEVKDMYLNNIDTSNLVNNKPLYYLVNKVVYY